VPSLHTHLLVSCIHQIGQGLKGVSGRQAGVTVRGRDVDLRLASMAAAIQCATELDKGSKVWVADSPVLQQQLSQFLQVSHTQLSSRTFWLMVQVLHMQSSSRTFWLMALSVKPVNSVRGRQAGVTVGGCGVDLTLARRARSFSWYGT
jgi:hypothetical protein